MNPIDRMSVRTMIRTSESKTSNRVSVTLERISREQKKYQSRTSIECHEFRCKFNNRSDCRLKDVALGIKGREHWCYYFEQKPEDIKP